MMRALMTFITLLFVGAGSLSAADDVEQLIGELTKVSEPGFGYSGSFSGSDFLPYDDTEELGTLVLGAAQRARSETLRKIVSAGAAAVPVLLKHIADQRPIAAKPMSGMMWMEFPDEYDFNRRTRRDAPKGVNRDAFEEKHPDKHALTVGDLCFVALGQIVNRNFNATRYQPTGGLVVSSPSYSQRLREVLLADWSDLTPEKHKRMLIEDFERPDHEGRQIGAYLRLSLYYPEAVEPLVLKELRSPTYDVFVVHDFCRDKLYKAAKPDERRQLYEQFIRQHGAHHAEAIADQLFDDLDNLEANEEGRLTPPLTDYGKQPRELLIQLFGKPADIRSSGRPPRSVASATERARLIRALAHDKSQKVGDVIRQVFLDNTEDDYLASACLRSLAHRGYADFLLEQLAKIDLAEQPTDSLRLGYLQSISESEEPAVERRLVQILTTTANEGYFMAALAGVKSADDATVLANASRILDSLPEQTTQGREVLDMIGERFPKQAPDLFRKFLSKDSPQRAATMCVVLWYGHPLSKEILAPLLDDKRELSGFSIPMRVCDRAAEAIGNTSNTIEFDSNWSLAQKDAAILTLKAYCAAAKSKPN